MADKPEVSEEAEKGKIRTEAVRLAKEQGLKWKELPGGKRSEFKAQAEKQAKSAGLQSRSGGKPQK